MTTLLSYPRSSRTTLHTAGRPPLVPITAAAQARRFLAKPAPTVYYPLAGKENIPIIALPARKVMEHDLLSVAL